MIIKLKNKDTLIIDNFKLKCCVGTGGLKKENLKLSIVVQYIIIISFLNTIIVLNAVAK